MKENSRKYFLIVPMITILFFFLSSVNGNDARVVVDCDSRSSWEIDSLLFGRFFEHHGADVYPGMYEEYIVNSSFEKWYFGEDVIGFKQENKNRLIWTDIKSTDGIAYPWEPLNKEISAGYAYDSDAVNTNFSQKISNSQDYVDVGIKQRLALPDYRVKKYNFEFYGKSLQGYHNVRIQLVDYDNKAVYAETNISINGSWQHYNGTLDIKNNSGNTLFMNRYGIFELNIIIEEAGDILLDQFMLFPEDAVNGVWNPESIANLKNIGVTTIRWPGGNFASSYHWKDGIGPRSKRIVKNNIIWTGLEPNWVGTDDFLEFCELAELTPLICVGYGDEITPQEAAEWVEYCNGDITTEYGALRAENGHPEPYNVKLWQVGNEVYGSYQLGHALAADYADGVLQYFSAMKAVDPSIKLITQGRDPYYHSSDNNEWNNTLFSIVGNKMDYLDIHRYVRVSNYTNNDKIRQSEILLTFNNQFEKFINSIKTAAENKGVDSVKLAVTEWALVSNEDVQLPHVNSFANGIFYAGMMNTFFRNGDFMKISCSHDFNLFTQPRAYRNTPVLPRSHVSKMYHDVKATRLLDLTTTCETFSFDADEVNRGQMIDMDNVPYIDAVALTNNNKSIVEIYVINRSLTNEYTVNIQLQGMDEMDKEIKTYLYHATGDPMARESWSNPPTWQITKNYFTEFYDVLTINLPKASLMRITVTDPNAVSVKKDDSKKAEIINLNQNYPNPFNPQTVIDYKLPKSEKIEISVYNTLGQKVKTLINKRQIAGNHSVSFDGSEFTSGIYFYTLKTKEATISKKMILLQ